MFEYINGELPDDFNNTSSYRHKIHVYTIKETNQLHTEQFPTDIERRYYGAKLWNNIFSNFTDVTFIYSLKVQFKDKL